MRRSTRAVAAALLSVAATAGSAQAATAPLRAYEVRTDGAGLERLASAGYDVTEGRDGNTVTVVATREQARQLIKDGLDAQRVAGQRVVDNYGPGNGYGVWRPYDRPAYNAAGTQVPNLVAQMQALAAENPGIVKLVRIGTTAGGADVAGTADDDFIRPKPIYAVKVSRDARSQPDGSKPAVLYSSTQHAREWLAAETNRRLLRLYVDNYGETGPAVGTDGAPVAGVTADELTTLVDQNELWFVLVANPNGYDYTFEDADTRLWRKNLRDNNANGTLDVFDGVDPNRNFPTHWGYDEEGSSSAPSSETFRGPSAASEPETKALEGLSGRVAFEFNNNFHTFGQLLLYPFGWQVGTYAADDPLFRAIAGSDENPAIPGFDPGVGAELYITNGDTNDHLYEAYDTLSFTPELKGGNPAAETGAGGFIFQDVEADVQAEFEDSVPFSLDMARSADNPADVESHLGNEAPDFEVDTFNVSYGDPQTVQVSAKRALGPVTANWQINQGPYQSAPTAEWTGGERYGDVGQVYYHRLRAQVTGAVPGDTVKVWFTADGGRKSKSFNYKLESDTGAPVVVISQENYAGPVPAYADPTKPAYLATHGKALADLGVPFDVWDVDARGQTAPDALGVLSHYRAIIWYTGDDFVTRAPGQPGATGALKVANDLTLAVRDRLNEGGKLLLAGDASGAQYFTPYEYAQFGEPVDTPTGYCAGPIAVADGCIPLSNDFFQYYLGGYTYIVDGGSPDGETAFDVVGEDALATLRFGLNPLDSAAAATTPPQIPSLPGTALVTSSILPPDRFPQFASESLAEYDRPGAAPYDPFAGAWYLFSGDADVTYRRLTTTVDLTGKTGGKLDFQASYDIEEGYDFMFVEAHTPGQGDWTTLPVTDDGGDEVSSDDTGLSCGGDGYTWQDDHPFLASYQTFSDPDTQCTPTGTTGEWNGVTGTSGGWQHLNVDLSEYDGQAVEVSITYAQDGAFAGLGVFLDELRTSAGATELSKTGFEADLGVWTVPGPPADSPGNADDWRRSQAAFDESPAIATEDTVWLTFGLETVDTEANRNALLSRVLTKFGIANAGTPAATPTPAPTTTVTPTPTPTPTPPPARKGKLKLGAGPVRATTKRTVPIKVKCVRAPGKRCKGAIALGFKGEAVGARPFNITPGVKTTIEVKLLKLAYQKLRAKGQLRMRAVAAGVSGGKKLQRASVKLTVRAPK